MSSTSERPPDDPHPPHPRARHCAGTGPRPVLRAAHRSAGHRGSHLARSEHPVHAAVRGQRGTQVGVAADGDATALWLQDRGKTSSGSRSPTVPPEGTGRRPPQSSRTRPGPSPWPSWPSSPTVRGRRLDLQRGDDGLAAFRPGGGTWTAQRSERRPSRATVASPQRATPSSCGRPAPSPAARIPPVSRDGEWRRDTPVALGQTNLRELALSATAQGSVTVAWSAEGGGYYSARTASMSTSNPWVWSTPETVSRVPSVGGGSPDLATSSSGDTVLVFVERDRNGVPGVVVARRRGPGAATWGPAVTVSSEGATDGCCAPPWRWTPPATRPRPGPSPTGPGRACRWRPTRRAAPRGPRLPPRRP